MITSTKKSSMNSATGTTETSSAILSGTLFIKRTNQRYATHCNIMPEKPKNTTKRRHTYPPIFPKSQISVL